MAATPDFSQAPWALDPDDGVLRNKVSNAQVHAPYWNGKLYSVRQVTEALIPKPKKEKTRMTIISEGSNFYIKSKNGELHSTRYRSRDLASDAARKISAGLIHFAPIVSQINRANLSNKL